MCVFCCVFTLFLPGCRLSAMTHPQSCRESLLSTLTEAIPEILFKGAELSQGKNCDSPAAVCQPPTQCFHKSLIREGETLFCCFFYTENNTVALLFPAKVVWL